MSSANNLTDLSQAGVYQPHLGDMSTNEGQD